MTAAFPVALIGAGNMGGAMAANLLERGWEVHVCDCVASRSARLAGLGASAHAEPASAAARAPVCVICVVDAAQTRDVLFGAGAAAAALRPGNVVLLCPTMAPEDVEQIAAELARLGIETLDAPMSGGPARARDGSMSLMLAGPRSVSERLHALIAALSNKVFAISERVGDGARTKLVNNLLAGINLVGAAEALALAQRLGLDPERTLDVVEQSSGQSWIGSERMRRALHGDLQPRAHMTLLAKDTRLALQAAAVAGFVGPLGAATRAVFAAACAAGLADQDDAALLQWLGGAG